MPLAACSVISGIDGFRKADCPGAVCADASTIDAPADAPVDAAGDANLEAGKGAAPVSWARWKMPNYVNDAGIPNPPSYEIANDDVVTDKVTGLVWRRAVLPNDLSFADADLACRALDPTNGPWRLPKRIELVSLLDYAQDLVRIDAVAFPGVKNVLVWTSSELRPFNANDNPRYISVNFGSGEVAPLPASLLAKALCVKASGS
jgi:hypothetical protein